MIETSVRDQIRQVPNIDHVSDQRPDFSQVPKTGETSDQRSDIRHVPNTTDPDCHLNHCLSSGQIVFTFFICFNEKISILMFDKNEFLNSRVL